MRSKPLKTGLRPSLFPLGTVVIASLEKMDRMALCILPLYLTSLCRYLMSDRFSLTCLFGMCTVGNWFIAESFASFRASSLSFFFLTFFQRQASCVVFAVSVSLPNVLAISTTQPAIVHTSNTTLCGSLSTIRS